MVRLEQNSPSPVFHVQFLQNQPVEPIYIHSPYLDRNAQFVCKYKGRSLGYLLLHKRNSHQYGWNSISNPNNRQYDKYYVF